MDYLKSILDWSNRKAKENPAILAGAHAFFATALIFVVLTVRREFMIQNLNQMRLVISIAEGVAERSKNDALLQLDTNVMRKNILWQERIKGIESREIPFWQDEKYKVLKALSNLSDEYKIPDPPSFTRDK